MLQRRFFRQKGMSLETVIGNKIADDGFGVSGPKTDTGPKARLNRAKFNGYQGSIT
jgi:hypothetical protein|tara:strand:+ start:6029 stop:6196 length:168 start_codon:yes stop_codon:yes gene_type:complete